MIDIICPGKVNENQIVPEDVPVITVIITAYNRKKYLLEAVNSVLNQTLSSEKYEIVVVKNFSDAEIDNYLDKNKITSIQGASPYWNITLATALEKSNGSVISFLDDDDYFDERKLEVVEDLFSKEDVVMCRDGVTPVLSDGTPIEEFRNKISTKTYIYLDHKGSIAGIKGFPSLFNNSSMSVLKIPFENHLHRLNENVPSGQGCRHSLDNFILFSSLESGKCAIIPDKLTFYRMHSNQVTANKEESGEFYLKKVETEKLFRDSYISMAYAFSSKEILERIDDIVTQTELQIALLNMDSTSFSLNILSKALHHYFLFREKYILVLILLYFMRVFLPRFSGLLFKSIIINLARKTS